jgi:uncharacterized tellurite resistance protein B-like protein
MSLVDFSRLKQLFREAPPGASEELYHELFLLVLARATDADAYTHPAEVGTVRRLIKDYLGTDVSEAEVRTAALSKLFEATPLHKCLADTGPQLSKEQRRNIVRALVEVFHADERVSSREAEFFNMVVVSLALTPADAAGLLVD